MRSDPQLDDITIPDIEITDGWSVHDIKDADECDEAYAYLMAAVAEIEHQLEMKEMGVSVSADPTWPARARRALKYKRAALQLVGYKRGRLAEDRKRAFQANRDRALLEHIKSVVSPDQFHAWCVSFLDGAALTIPHPSRVCPTPGNETDPAPGGEHPSAPSGASYPSHFNEVA